jgi:hypothetical protein
MRAARAERIDSYNKATGRIFLNEMAVYLGGEEFNLLDGAGAARVEDATPTRSERRKA